MTRLNFGGPDSAPLAGIIRPFGVVPMHSIVVAVASLFVAAASVRGIGLPLTACSALLVVSVSVVGVPHGGLDHWIGRRLLENRLSGYWPLVFFPAYLTGAVLVVVGWHVAPFVTAVSFFLISAWHFGLEDSREEGVSNVYRHLSAVAIGGLVIWIPVLVQPMRVESLLASILPRELGVSAATIVAATGRFAIIMLPVAAFVTARDMVSAGGRGHAFRNICFALMFATTEVLLSFGIYFCAWHSIRGLRRLADVHQIGVGRVWRSAMPMSIAAILMAASGTWLWTSGQGFSEATTRTLFVALSAMAVPHLLLHGPISALVIDPIPGKRTGPVVGATP